MTMPNSSEELDELLYKYGADLTDVQHIKFRVALNAWHSRECAKNELAARKATLEHLAEKGNEFARKTGSLEAGYAHIRDLIQQELAELNFKQEAK